MSTLLRFLYLRPYSQSFTSRVSNQQNSKGALGSRLMRVASLSFGILYDPCRHSLRCVLVLSASRLAPESCGISVAISHISLHCLDIDTAVQLYHVDWDERCRRRNQKRITSSILAASTTIWGIHKLWESSRSGLPLLCLAIRHSWLFFRSCTCLFGTTLASKRRRIWCCDMANHMKLIDDESGGFQRSRIVDGIQASLIEGWRRYMIYIGSLHSTL